MIYKMFPTVQDYVFKDMDSFLMDLEETFQSLIQSDKEGDYKTMYIVAPKYFIEDLVYHLVLSPHLAENVVTRFSLFDEYTFKELAEIFANEDNEYLQFAITEDRVCFVDEPYRRDIPIIDEDDFDHYKFYYFHNDSPYKYLKELKHKNMPTLVFDFM